MNRVSPKEASTRGASLQSSGVAVIGAAPRATASLRGDGVLASDGATHFELRAEIARGGMGRIFEGWDPRHQRKVAIKLLLHRSASMARRFAREASITARLQHPAIVPVYDSGVSASGEPFYAMKLVDGRSLADAVGDCASFQERVALLPHIVAITDALSYAHAYRVIHRDLKPSNVLLGAHGETVVIDWGLAKELDEAHHDEGDSEAEPAALTITVAGAALGTPRYMPPEQARGEAVDERSDVYALGALLYHVLAGLPPYEGASRDDALTQVKAGPPRPVATVEPRVPADLAAIVAKAMARAPDDRYATATEMAADLKRFGAGQLVSVHSYTLGALVRRWAARHAAPLAVATILLLVLASVAGVSVRRIVRERDRADAANVLAGREREAMALQRDAAEKLVAFVITSLRDRLEQVGRLDVLGGVGAEVSGYYESVAPLGKGADLGVLDRRASAAETLAGVEEARHAPTAARAQYESAEALRHELVARDGGVAQRTAEGALLVRRARFELNERSVSAAEAPAARAAAIGDEIVGADPTSAPGLALVTRAHAALGAVLRRKGELEAATTEANRAIYAARHLLARQGSSPDTLRVMGVALDEATGIDQSAGRFASPNLDEGVDVRERLVAASPDDAQDRLALSKAYELRAFCRRDDNRLDLALADAERTRTIREALAQRDPDNSEWQRLLGQSYDTLCSTQQLAGHAADAVASCKQSIAILERVVGKTPDAPRINDNLLLAYQRLGWVYERNHRLAEAATAFQASLPIAARFAASDDTFVSRLADAYGMIAQVASERGDTKTAREQTALAIAALEPLLKPGAAFEVTRTVIFSRLQLAGLDEDAGDKVEARRLILAALELLLRGPLDLNEESEIGEIAQVCAMLLPSDDPHARDVVTRTIAILEPLRVKGADPAARLALLSRAKRQLQP